MNILCSQVTQTQSALAGILNKIVSITFRISTSTDACACDQPAGPKTNRVTKRDPLAVPWSNVAAGLRWRLPTNKHLRSNRHKGHPGGPVAVNQSHLIFTHIKIRCSKSTKKLEKAMENPSEHIRAIACSIIVHSYFVQPNSHKNQKSTGKWSNVVCRNALPRVDKV